MSVVGHHKVFHNALASSHDVHRISGLIGRNAEKVLRRIDGEKVHQLLGLDVVVLDESLNRILILLRTHMFVSRKVGDNVEAFLLTEDALKNRICKG